MDKKQNDIEEWFQTGSKNEVFLKKSLLLLVMTWLIYQTGYAIGTFLAHFAL